MIIKRTVSINIINTYKIKHIISNMFYHCFHNKLIIA